MEQQSQDGDEGHDGHRRRDPPTPPHHPANRRGPPRRAIRHGPAHRRIGFVKMARPTLLKISARRFDVPGDVGQGGMGLHGLVEHRTRGVELAAFFFREGLVTARSVQGVKHEQAPVGHVGVETLADGGAHLLPVREGFGQRGVFFTRCAQRLLLRRRQVVVEKYGVERVLHGQYVKRVMRARGRRSRLRRRECVAGTEDPAV